MGQLKSSLHLPRLSKKKNTTIRGNGKGICMGEVVGVGEEGGRGEGMRDRIGQHVEHTICESVASNNRKNQQLVAVAS